MLNAVYKQNKRSDSADDHATKCAKNSQNLFKLLVIAYCGAGVLLSLSPLVRYLITGTLQLPLYQEIYGVAPSTAISFAINWVYHGYITIVSASLITLTDVVYIVQVYNVSLFSGLIDHQMTQLGAMLEMKLTPRHEWRITATVRNIVKMRMEMNR